MKVTYYYRPKQPFAFSIEGVFKVVKDQLRNRISISDYFCTLKWKRFYSLFTAPKYKGDINHITGDAHFLALTLPSKNTILTIHDIGHYERTLKGAKKVLFKIFWLDLPLSRVRFVTTISEFTKASILKHTNISPDKIKVIYNPAADDFHHVSKEFNESQPAVLQIGSGDNKNIFRLIEAVEGLNFKLILIRKRDASIQALLESKGIAFEWYNNLTREELFLRYQSADVIFFASEYEGFGVPILEANAVGRPVITSNITSMPEVAGDSALLVDPFNVNEIRNALLTIRDNGEIRNTLVKKGFTNLKRFAPEVIADQYFELYQKILR